MAKEQQYLKNLKRVMATTNPLKDLTASNIEQLLQSSKLGNDSRLQQTYQEMEKITPIFQICIERRISQIINRGWSILPNEKNDNSLETQRQKTTLENLLKKSDNKTKNSLTDAIRHLGLYSFRGRSIVKPFFNNGDIEFVCLDNVNVLKDLNDNYWWTDEPSMFMTFDGISSDKSKLIPQNEIIAISTDKPIDYPGLLIYLRQAIGELQWARFIEKQGIPQVVITAPEGTTDSEFTQFTQRAMGIFEGGSGALPNGTNLNVLDSARGQDPFTEFLKHQNDTIAILALGSTAAIYPQNSGLGSDLNSVQQQVLNNLVSNDCRLIQNAISEYFKNIGFNKVHFSFNGLKNYSTEQILAIAKEMHQMGMKIDKNKLIKEIDLDIFVDDNVVTDEIWQPKL